MQVQDPAAPPNLAGESDPHLTSGTDNQAKNDGTYEKIYEKWFIRDAWMKELQ